MNVKYIHYTWHQAARWVGTINKQTLMYKMKVKWNSAVFQQSALGFLLEKYKYFVQSQLSNLFHKNAS